MHAVSLSVHFFAFYRCFVMMNRMFHVKQSSLKESIIQRGGLWKLPGSLNVSRETIMYSSIEKEMGWLFVNIEIRGVLHMKHVVSHSVWSMGTIRWSRETIKFAKIEKEMELLLENIAVRGMFH